MEDAGVTLVGGGCARRKVGFFMEAIPTPKRMSLPLKPMFLPLNCGRILSSYTSIEQQKKEKSGRWVSKRISGRDRWGSETVGEAD